MSKKRIGIVTPDLARVRFIVPELEQSDEFEPSVVISQAWQEGNIFDFGQLYAKSDVIYFDGITPALAFYARINVDKKCILRLFGPELTVDSTRTLPWKKVTKGIVVNPYYYDKFGAPFSKSLEVSVNLVKIDRPETFVPDTSKIKLKRESKRFVVFHSISPEFDLLSLVPILKNNPEYSCSLVGKKVSDSYLDILYQALASEGVGSGRLELYENLAPDVLNDFVEDHPHVVSLRPDEAVFHNVREMVALGCKPHIRKTAISSGMFDKSMVFDTQNIRFSTDEYVEDLVKFCKTGEKELTLNSFKEA